MQGQSTTTRDRRPGVALWLSSSLVLAGAVGFDLLAEEAPTHVLTVALAALIVGVGRLWTGHRWGAVAAAMNLAVVGQPAVHALSKLSHPDSLAHDHAHDVPTTLTGVALHAVVAVLVVAVASSHAACLRLAGVVVRAVGHLRALACRTPAPVPAPRLVARAERRAARTPRRDRVFERAVPRRGPPVPAGSAA